jgi:hypothetical protein
MEESKNGKQKENQFQQLNTKVMTTTLHMSSNPIFTAHLSKFSFLRKQLRMIKLKSKLLMLDLQTHSTRETFQAQKMYGGNSYRTKTAL